MYWGYIRVTLGLYWDYIGVILGIMETTIRVQGLGYGLYRNHGKENGNCYNGVR